MRTGVLHPVFCLTPPHRAFAAPLPMMKMHVLASASEFYCPLLTGLGIGNHWGEHRSCIPPYASAALEREHRSKAWANDLPTAAPGETVSGPESPLPPIPRRALEIGSFGMQGEEDQMSQ